MFRFRAQVGGARMEEHVAHGWAGLGWSEHVYVLYTYTVLVRCLLAR